MIMYDRRDDNISGYSPAGNRRSSFQSRNWFSLRKLLLLLLILLLPVSSVAENVNCKRLPFLMENLLDNHYSLKNVTGEILTRAVDQMIKKLDPSKTLLYESDVKRLKPLLRSLFVNARRGNCTALHQVYDLMVQRAQENEDIVKNILGPGYKLDETVELNVDVRKRSYLQTRAEKQELLRKIVHFQIGNSLMAGIKLDEAKKQQLHQYKLLTKRIVENDPEKLITDVAEAFALALDPHTSYLSPDNFEDLQIHMQLSLEGIGAVLSSDNGFTVIEELIPGGGAERSGLLKLKDKIIAVAQDREKPVNVIDMNLRDVIKMIRGKKGTKVTLTILRQEKQTKRFNVTITRDKVDIKEQEAKIEYHTRTATDGRQYRFGVIDLPSFYGNESENKSCYEDVKDLLNAARLQQVDGIVLDLSRNAGGLLKESLRLVGLFIDQGGIVATKDSHGQVTILASGSTAPGIKNGKRKVITFPPEDRASLYLGPLVVLTSRLSASASEIVAGALQDYHRAVIVGSDHTFGKGSVQMLMPLPLNLGAISVTTALYFLPGGQSTQNTGVEADVRLPAWFILDDFGEKSLDYPLPAQAITSFLSPRGSQTLLWKPVNRSMITELAARSKTRVAKDEKFAEIIKNNKEAAGKNGLIRLADLRKEMDKKNDDNKKDETLTEARQKARERYAPFVNESVNVLLDMVTMDSAPTAPASRQTEAASRRL